MMQLQEFARRGGKVSRAALLRIDTPFGPYVAVQSVTGHVGAERRPVSVDVSDIFRGCEAWPEEQFASQVVAWCKRHHVFGAGLGLLDVRKWEY